MTTPLLSNYFFTNSSESFQDFGRTLWSTLQGAIHLPKSVLTTVLGSRGEAIANFTTSYFQNITDSVHSEFILPVCSLHSLKESCVNWDLTSNNLTSFLPPPDPISNFTHENGSFFEKLTADFTSTAQSAFEYTTGKYIRYGLIFASAMLSLRENGLNYKGIKKCVLNASSWTLAELTISRYGFIYGFFITMRIQNILHTTRSKGIFSGIKQVVSLAAINFTFASLNAYTNSSTLSIAIFMLSSAILNEIKKNFNRSEDNNNKIDQAEHDPNKIFELQPTQQPQSPTIY